MPSYAKGSKDCVRLSANMSVEQSKRELAALSLDEACNKLRKWQGYRCC